MARVAWNESAMQSHLFSWIDGMALECPFMRLAFHPANGGHRHISTAERLKREGVRPGVPDVMIPVAICDSDGDGYLYYGMALELKVGNNKLTHTQAWYMNELVNRGWKCVVVRDFYEVAAWHIARAYHMPYALADYAAVNQSKWSGVMNNWTKAQWDEATKGGYDVRNG